MKIRPKRTLEDDSHKEMRAILRVVGPLLVIFGGVLTLIGLGSFFSAFGSFGMPRYFWCAFIGMPMVGVGLSLCQFAFLGTYHRYLANETAPVARDTFNYLVDGTQEAVKILSKSVGQGLSEGINNPAADPLVCSQCNDRNAADANFCNACGAPLVAHKICGQCSEMNDATARFCDHCGNTL